MSSVEKHATKQDWEFQLLCQELISNCLDEISEELESNSSDEISTTTSTSSMSFHLFPNFPLEIRRLIWRHAFFEPQLHIVSSKVATHSRISVIMQSCREAFQEGIHIRLPYYTFCDYSDWTESHRHGPLPRHYMQPDLDTLWIVENNTFGNYPSFIPPALSFYDGNRPFRQVKTLAFNASCWKDPARVRDNTWSNGSLPSIPYGMCEEIVIVLNNLPMPTDRGVIFTEPSPTTKDSRSTDTLSSGAGSDSKSYFDEAKKRTAVMEEFKDYQSKIRESTLEKDLLYLESPRIRYVEARPGITYAAPLQRIHASKPTEAAPLSVMISTIWSRDNLPSHLNYLVTGNEQYLTHNEYITCDDHDSEMDNYSRDGDNEDRDIELDDEPREFDSEYSSDSDTESLPDYLCYLLTGDERYVTQDPGMTDDYSDNEDNEDRDNERDDEPREFDSDYTSGSDTGSDLDASEDASISGDY